MPASSVTAAPGALEIAVSTVKNRVQIRHVMPIQPHK
jgi:hypothetical protein